MRIPLRAGLDLLIGEDGVGDFLGLVGDQLAHAVHDALCLVHPAAAVQVYLDELRLQGEVRDGVVEGVVLGAEHGDGHPLGVRLYAQFPKHGDAVTGIAGYGEPMDFGLAAEEIEGAVFLQHLVVPAEAAAGQHDRLTVDMYLAAGVPGDDAADMPRIIQLQVLRRCRGQNLHRQVLPLNGIQHHALDVGAAPAGANGIVPAQEVLEMPVAHLQNAVAEHGTVEVCVGGLFQGVDLCDVAVVAEPVKEVAYAVNGRMDQLFFNDASAALIHKLHRALPGVGDPQPLVPLGIRGHIAVGKVGVAAELGALFQQDDLLPGLGRPDGGHKAGAGANHHNVAVQFDWIMLADHCGGPGLLMAGTGVADLGAQAALDTFFLVDLILGAYKIDGLDRTVAGTVVAAGADLSVDYKHGI